MSSLAVFHPVKVNRSELREQQSRYLREASGNVVIEIVGRSEEEERYIVDKQYFDELIEKLKATKETMEILSDRRLFNQIMKASATIDEDIRLGKLHSFEEAFGEE